MLQVVRRNANDLLSVAAEKAFHNWITKYEFYAPGVEPLVLQRGSRRSAGDAVRALGWYRKFREGV